MRRPGRPTKLTPAVADQLVALVGGRGHATDVARSLRLDPRMLTNWRTRDWSPRPQDAPSLELEKRLIAAFAVRRQVPLAVSWKVAAAAWEEQFRERWAIDES